MTAPDDPGGREGGPPSLPPSPEKGSNLSTSLDMRVAAVLFGVVAAVLHAAPLTGVPLAAAFSFFSAMPIFYVGFARGPVAAIIAAVVAVLAVGVAAAPLAGLSFAASTAVPAAYAAFLVNLARPADELGGPSDRIAWYPLADVLLRLCLTVAAGAVVLGVALGYDLEGAREQIVEGLTQIGQQADASLDEMLGGALSNEAARESLAAALAGILPVVQPFSAVLILVANLHFSMRLARARGVLKRPPDDMRLALRLPLLGLVAFGLSIVLAFGTSDIAVMARAFAGALGAGFMIAGFAIIHWALRDNGARVPALVGLYLLVPLLSGLPAIAMVAVGLFSTARAVPISKRD